MPKKTLAKDIVRDYINQHPHAKNQEIIEALKIPTATFYRVKNAIAKEPPISYRANFMIPDFITKGMLPPPKYKEVHLAAYLNNFSFIEIVPPYEKTKAEIMFQIKQKYEADPDLVSDLVYGLQERLAIFSIIQGDPSAFNKTIGHLVPPESFL